MSNIATKLTYLNGTKQAIKQAINEDFEVIDDNTTFREYADEISSNNAKYKDLIPKETTNATNTLDISNSSGLDKALVTQYGNTYQEGEPTPDTPQEIVNISGKSTLKDVGKNLFDVTTIRNAINGSISNNTIISNAISTSYGGVSANITGTTLSPGTYYLSLKAKIDSGSASALNKITLVGINNDEVTEIEKPTISSSYQIYVIQITINETKTITNIGVQLGYTNTNAVISYKDIMISKYSDTTYEPYQEQSYEINLGKNLLDLKDGTYSAEIIATVENGEITLNGTATANRFITINLNTNLNLLNEEQYTISANNEVANSNVRVRINDSGSYDDVLNSINATKTITYSNDALLYKNSIKIRVADGTTLTNFKLTPMIEQGSQATSYAPYITPIELCKIGDYKDRIYYNNGKWYLEKKIGKVVLDGSESWSLFAHSDSTDMSQLYTNVTNAYTPTENEEVCIASHFKKGKWNSYWTRGNEVFLGTSGRTGQLWLTPYGYTTASDFKTWLSNNNVIVYYVLATPTTEEITESNYPTLYNQLNNIKLYEGVNHLTFTNESGLDVEFDITYYKDWKLD